MNESSDRRTTDRRRSLDHDDVADSLNVLSRAILGYPDPVTKVHVAGIADDVKELKTELSWQNRIDRWILRGLMALALIKFLGIDHLQDLLHMFGFAK